MKHDFIDIMHDRLSQHEMIEPSGLWQDIENSLDSRGTHKKGIVISRSVFYKAVAGIAAAALVAVVMWTTLKNDSNHDSDSQKVAASTSRPSKLDGRKAKAVPTNLEDKTVNNTPQLAATNHREENKKAGTSSTIPSVGKRCPISTKSEDRVKSPAQEQIASINVDDSLLYKEEDNQSQVVAKEDLAIHEKDTIIEKVDFPSIIPQEPVQQIPQLWAISDKPRNNKQPLEFAFSYNGFLGSAGSADARDLEDFLPGLVPQNSSSDPFEPQDQGPIKIDEKEQIVPVRIGLDAWYPIGEKWRVGSGLVYTHLIRKTTTIYNKGDIRKTETASYLGIPVEVSRILWNRRRWSFYASAGAMIEFNLKSKLQEKADVRIINIKEFKDKRPQFSALGRLGLQYNVIDRIGIYFEPGASYYFHNGADDNIYMSHPLRFDINLGLKINLGK
ncbi:MAG: hypothetical protein IKX31_08420 [Muribaculaceae bacterium]|nr:hypothetical protein [Muribaculaceae bacterium]